MNDFTKEELKILKSSLRIILGEVGYLHHEGDEYQLLSLKLQSMIDNYEKNKQAWEYLDLLNNSGNAD